MVCGEGGGLVLVLRGDEGNERGELNRCFLYGPLSIYTSNGCFFYYAFYTTLNLLLMIRNLSIIIHVTMSL